MIIGITGSIAMGKSTVTNYLLDLGYEVIDSDQLVAIELENEATIKEIVSHFGTSILTDNQIDRKRLGKIVFASKTERECLNNIIHPKIIQTIKLLTKNKNLIFVDIPLLYEVNLESIVDKVIVIYTSLETQINRLIERDQISKDYAIIKISSQMDIEIKKAKADFLINNDYELVSTYKQIDEILRRIKDEI